jgi:sarcosine oxidase subunit gamma
MLERASALASARPYKSDGLAIEEARGFSLTQVAGRDSGFESLLAGIVGELPPKTGRALELGGRTLMRTGPVQFWIIAPQADDLAARLQGHCAVTPLSNSRVRIRLDGAPARDVLAKLIPLDFHPPVFTTGTFAMTGIHHTPVTVHCLGENRFDVYALRTFALNVWEVITDAALEYC